MNSGTVPFPRRVLGHVIAFCVFTIIGTVNILLYVLKPSYKRIKDRPIPPKCLTNLKHGDHKYIQANGLKFHYVEKGDRLKPLMVFVHGFPEFWYSWRHQLEEFSKDYWCVALDMRGYGDSEKPRGKMHYRSINMVNDIKEIVSALGRERFTLVGHDWGSLITWEFVQIYGNMVDCFVTMSAPSTGVYFNVVFSELWQFLRSWYVFFFQGPYIPEMLLRSDDLNVFNQAFTKSVSPEDIEAYKYTYSKKGAFTGPINYYRENFLKSFVAHGKKIPRGLYILGENDPFISISTVKMMANNHKELQTHILKGGMHFIQQECHQEVNQLIRDFIKNK